MAWERAGGLVVPGAAEISAAERDLAEIARSPIASGLVFGDADGWLAARHEELRLAKALVSITATDLPALARAARAGSEVAARRLGRALVVEALCLDALPVSPSRTLAECGVLAPSNLVRLAEIAIEAESPRSVRALAAMTIGAIARESRSPARLDKGDAVVRRAFGYALANGMPSEPAVAATLLGGADGEALVARYELASTATRGFVVPPLLVRELLAGDVPASEVVALVEAAADAEAVSVRLMSYRAELPEPYTQQCRRAAAARLHAEREEALSELSRIFLDGIRKGADAATHRAVARLVLDLFDVSPQVVPAARSAAVVIRNVLDLPRELWLPCLDWLHEVRAKLWPSDDSSPGNGAGYARHWFDTCWVKNVRPTVRLLGASRDLEVVRRAYDLGVIEAAGAHTFRDPDLYRLFISLVTDFWTGVDSYLPVILGQCLQYYRTVRAARTELDPLADALRDIEPVWRERVFFSVLRILFTWEGRAAERAHVVPHAARLARFVAAPGVTDSLLNQGIEVAAAIDRAMDDPEPWLTWVLGEARTLRDVEWYVAPAAKLALALAGGSFDLFRAIFVVAVRERDIGSDVWREQAARALHRCPAARVALAGAFLERPARAMRSLVRLIQATQIGSGALEPLGRLAAPEGEDAPTGDGWDALLSGSPELAPLAAEYVRARRLLGRDTALPAGVRRALGLVVGLERELAYLSQLATRDPNRAGVPQRMASLRERLADRDALDRAARHDASARLARVASEAMFDAVERLILDGYRARLATVVGHVPEALHLDDDLLNAILLSVEIEDNRRLLLDLLRAHVRGDGEWRVSLPANAAFLERLSTAGVDPAVWLDTHPRRYPVEAARGGSVRLAFESDPLAILQMGNYFETCLSVRGCNAFAAVANACDLNKRVVYGRDGAGRVVARKLVCLDEEGRLVGFRTYVGLHDDTANTALETAMRDYVARFVAACGLQLVDDGSIPRLVSECWYDDGAVAWDETSEGSSLTGAL